MGKKLTKNLPPKPPQRLTARNEVPFILCFQLPLEKGYTFQQLEKSHLKEFQMFLNKVSQMTVNQVDNQFRRKSDKTDQFQGDQVIHYAVSEAFRIHGVMQNGKFLVLRLDPNHRFHL